MIHESNEDFPLEVRIQQINDGRITINHKTITVKSVSEIGSQNTRFIRIFNKEELDSIELATKLTSSEEKFRKCYEAAKDLFKCMNLLYYYGNPYHTISFRKFSEILNNDAAPRYLGNYLHFFDLIKREIPPTLIWETQIDISNSFYNIPKLPRFLTVENVLFLSISKNAKEYIEKLGYKNIKQSTNPLLKNFPYLSMIELLTTNEQSINNSGTRSINFLGRNGQIVEKKFFSIIDFFELNNIHFIKVDKPVHCYQVLYLASQIILGNDLLLGQILYCHKNTDIRHFLKEFTSIQTKSFQKCIIFHPEFLDESNRNILLEESKARISAVSIRDNQKILVISSIDFTTEKDFVTYFDQDDITSCRLTSIKALVEPDITDIHLESSSYQDKKDKKDKNDEIVQFIDRENQHVQFTRDKRIRFKFAPELFDDAIDFWDELYSTIFYTYYVTDNEIILFDSSTFPAIFEEPKEGLINNLNDFPFPIQSDRRGHKIVPFPTYSPNASKENENKNKPSCENFLNSIFSKKEHFNISIDEPLITIIQKLYKFLFNVDNFNKDVSIHLLQYISEYILKFTTNYLDCLWAPEIRIRRTRALLLIKSALHVYNLAPNNDFSIMCFNGMLDKQESMTVDFYTTCKRKDELLFHTKNIFDYTQNPNQFVIHYRVNEKDDINNDQIYSSFVKCLTKNETIQKDISDIFADKSMNKSIPKSSSTKFTIMNYSLSWPKFFKAVSIVSRLYLSHPTILSGDTGCGKTSFIHMFQQIVNKINNYNIDNTKTDNCKIKFFPDLNIHGDVNRKDIENHIRTSYLKTPSCNTFFFDEFNTSDALPYIENIFINGYTESGIMKPFNFLGAINPLVKADSISKVLSKIGMEQNIFTETSEVNLLNHKKSEENLNDYKYFVHQLTISEDLIIDFNPMMIEPSKESQYLPNEEKMLIRKVVKLNLLNTIEEEYINSLFTCIEWIRQFMRENAVVSVRDVKSVLDFYNHYNFEIKNDKNLNNLNKQSFELAIISVFALRLPLKLEIPNNNNDILEHAKSLSMDISEDEKIIFVRQSFLKNVGDPNELMNLFDKFTYWILRKSIMKDDKIWKFKSFLYHVVVMMMTIKMKKACFVIGPPGTSKSFALEQIAKYDYTFITTYMCSRGSSSEGLKAQFYDAVYIGKINLNKCTIESKPKAINNSVISFEEMGLANINKRRPLKYIHFALDLGIEINEEHQFEKVACIGVSNYAMDLANMNRGTLVYTDIPDIIDLKINFSNKILLEKDYKNVEFSKFDNIYNELSSKEEEMKIEARNNWIEDFFEALWPNNSKPNNLALRSIYSLYQITRDAYFKENEEEKITPSFFCRVAREIVNARRLIKINENKKINNDFKDLSIHAFDFILRMFPKCIYNIPDVLLEKPKGNINFNDYKFEIVKDRKIKCIFEDGEIKYFNIKVDNLYIMLDRIITKDSSKSLCLLTQDYSALDNIHSILLDNLPETTEDLQFILDSNDQDEVIEKIKNMPKSKYPDISFYFEEDFKETDSSSKSQKSVNNFIQSYIRNPNEIPIIVGNNPMLDSLLDILNANKIDPSDTKKKTFNALISSDGFSWSYDIRTDFYLVLILELNELVSKIGAIPLPLLDRLEIVYIDWSLLKYLTYFKLINKSKRFAEEFKYSGLSYRKFVDQIDNCVCQYLNTQISPDNQILDRFDEDNVDQCLHSSLVKLFADFDDYINKNNKIEEENNNNNNNNNDDNKNSNKTNTNNKNKGKNSNKKNSKNKNKNLNKNLIKNKNKKKTINNKNDNDDNEEKVQLITNNDLNDYLLYTRWNKSIKCVIYTKSMLGDEIHFADERKNNNTAINEIFIDDETIADEDDFNKQFENKEETRPLIIKCSKYSEMHDQHLKKLIEKRNFEGSVFIIYYYTGKENIKSTMNWPVFWIEDISNNFLVMNSNNSAHLKYIYNNLSNQEFKNKNKPIMDYLVITRLFTLLSIPNEYLNAVRLRFREFIKVYYQDNCSNLIDHFDEFEENENSPYSIQTQIFNHLMNQIKEKLFYFVSITVSHFLANTNMDHFMPKKVYDFLRENYEELPKKIDFEPNKSDFKSIFKDYVKDFLCNSPLLYFPNTFGHRFLSVVKENSPFEQFIELFKNQRYRNQYFYQMKFENDENLIKHLNRHGFRINKKYSRQLFELITGNDEFYNCSEQLLLSKGIRINDIIHPQDPLIQTYYYYTDKDYFDQNIEALIILLNSNEKNDIITNSFEGIFIYFNYILNIDIVELMPKQAYEDFTKFYEFDYDYNPKIFWNSYILSYIVSKKKKDPKILLKYKNVIENIEYNFFSTKENFDLNYNIDLVIFCSKLYARFFFTAPQIASTNSKINKEFINVLTDLFTNMSTIDRLQINLIDLTIVEELIRSSCFLDFKEIKATPEKSDFERFTHDFPNLKYCNEMVNRIHSINIGKQRDKTTIVEYDWDKIKNNILNENIVKKLIERQELDNLVDAPDFKNHSLLEIIHLYMTDIDSFEQIMGDMKDRFILWFFQDTKESSLFILQIYLLFRAVQSKDELLIENQLIALLGLSSPWKIITHENLGDFKNSKYNFFAFSTIESILKLPVTYTRDEIINSIPDNLKLLKSTTEGRGGYTFIDGKDLYIFNETLPTISTVIYNYFVFNKQNEFPVLKSFIQFQKNRHFLNIASKIMKISFKLRKIFAKNSRALFVILNCFSFIKNEEYELIQDLPFVSSKFDKLFNLKNNENRNIFTKDDFNDCQNAYQQIEFVSKKYFEIHNDFITFQNDKIVLPAYDFIPKMSITQFDFDKFVAESVLKPFVKFRTVISKFISPQEMNELLLKTLQNNFFPLVTFDVNKRFKFDNQPILETPQNVDFLGMCKEDWEKILSVLVNEPDSSFVKNIRKDPDQTKGFNMTKIASFLLQIYYRDQSEEYLDEISPRLDFGDQITINMGFEIPDIILNAPIFDYLPNDIKNIIRNVLN